MWLRLHCTFGSEMIKYHSGIKQLPDLQNCTANPRLQAIHFCLPGQRKLLWLFSVVVKEKIERHPLISFTGLLSMK